MPPDEGKSRPASLLGQAQASTTPPVVLWASAKTAAGLSTVLTEAPSRFARPRL